MSAVNFFTLKTIHPMAIGGAVDGGWPTPPDKIGKPVAWIVEEKPGYFLARTNMSEWVNQPIITGSDNEGKTIFKEVPVPQNILLGAGSYVACEAAVRLYNV